MPVNPSPAGDAANMIRLGKPDNEMPAVGPAVRVRTLHLRLLADVTLCTAIGGGSRGAPAGPGD